MNRVSDLSHFASLLAIITFAYFFNMTIRETLKYEHSLISFKFNYKLANISLIQVFQRIAKKLPKKKI